MGVACEHQHPFGEGGKDLEGGENVFSRYIEPGASPQLVFDCLRLLFARGTQWVWEDDSHLLADS